MVLAIVLQVPNGLVVKASASKSAVPQIPRFGILTYSFKVAVAMTMATRKKGVPRIRNFDTLLCRRKLDLY